MTYLFQIGRILYVFSSALSLAGVGEVTSDVEVNQATEGMAFFPIANATSIYSAMVESAQKKILPNPLVVADLRNSSSAIESSSGTSPPIESQSLAKISESAPLTDLQKAAETFSNYEGQSNPTEIQNNSSLRNENTMGNEGSYSFSGSPGNLNSLAESLKPLKDVGRLPLPIAKVAPSGQTTFIQNYNAPKDAISEFGGKPVTSFGSSDANKTDSYLAKNPMNQKKKPEESKPKPTNNGDKEQQEKEEKKIRENMEKSVDALLDASDPFKENDLNAYRAARDIFFDTPQSAKMLDEIVKDKDEVGGKLQGLFDSFSPRDKEEERQKAKQAYQDFLQRLNASTPLFPAKPRKLELPHNVDRPTSSREPNSVPVLHQGN